MHYIYFITALFAGALMPLQGAMNARIGSHLHHPMQATLVSFLIGLIFCVIYVLAISAPLPNLKTLATIDWKLYLGGILGVFFVTVMLMLIPKIGFANVVTAVIVGQLVVSVLFDHYGFFGNAVISLNPYRIIGVLLLLVGLYLIQFNR